MSVSALDKRIAKIAENEWWYFGGQFINGDNPDTFKRHSSKHATEVDGNEDKAGFKQRIWTYFKFGVYPDPTDNGWQAKKNLAWSAGFISFCMRMGGAGDGFPYSASHSIYVNQAVRNQLNNVPNSITAHDKTDMAPSIGDLLWKGREATADWDYDRLVEHVKNGGGTYKSHCDLVVWVDRVKNHVYAIGGNVSNRVLRLRVNIDEDGLIKSKRYVAVIRNNLVG